MQPSFPSKLFSRQASPPYGGGVGVGLPVAVAYCPVFPRMIFTSAVTSAIVTLPSPLMSAIPWLAGKFFPRIMFTSRRFYEGCEVKEAPLYDKP